MSGMRNTLVAISALLAGGVLSLVGLALSCVLTFFAMFYALCVVCWVTKNDDWMFAMWLGIIVVPAGGIVLSTLCVIAAAEYVERRRKRQSQGFDVVSDSRQPDTPI